MSCLNPVNIINPSRYFRSTKDKLYLDVPCGHCEGCQHDKRNDWCTRAYYEYLYTKKSGGFTLMVLLTYRDSCLPRFDKMTNGEINSSLPCFNSHDIAKLIDGIRKRCKRRKYEVPHYLIGCEYGTRFTHRPHYHALFHVSGNTFSPKEFLEMLYSLWHYGLVSPDKQVEQLIVSNFKGIEYTAKYVTKDLDFFETTDSLFYEDIEGNKVPFYDVDGVELYKKYSNTLPLRKSSYQYGSQILDFLGVHINEKKEAVFNNDDYQRFYDIMSEGLRFEFDTHFHSIPRYILNKLRLVYVEDGVTDRGNKRYKSYNSPLWIDYKRNCLDNIIDKEAIRLQHDFMQVNAMYEENKGDLHTMITWMRENHVTYKDLAQFKICCFNRVFDPCDMALDMPSILEYMLYGCVPDAKEVQQFDKTIRNWYIDKLIFYPEVENKITRQTIHDLENSPYQFNELPIFKHFPELIDFSNKVRASVKKSTQTYRLIKINQQNRLKKFFEK